MSDPGDGAEVPQERSARLTSRKGWFQVWKADLALINENCGGENTGSVKAVLLAFLQLGNDRQTFEFTVSIALLTHLSGVSRRTVQRAIQRLAALGFIGVEHHRGSEGKRFSDASTYRLLKGGRPKITTGGRSKRPTGGKPKRPTGVCQVVGTSVAQQLKELSALKQRELNKEEDKNARALPRATASSLREGSAPGASGSHDGGNWKPGEKGQYPRTRKKFSEMRTTK